MHDPAIELRWIDEKLERIANALEYFVEKNKKEKDNGKKSITVYEDSKIVEHPQP